MWRTASLALLTVAVAVLLAAPASAVPAGEPGAVAVLGVDVRSAPAVTLTVAPRLPPTLGGGATGPPAFVLTEDGMSRAVDVAPVATEDLEVVLLLDTSGAAEAGQWRAVQSAVVEFVLRVPEVPIAVVGYGAEPQVVAPLSADRRGLLAALRDLEPTDGTALRAAVPVALEQFSPGARQRVVVVVSSSQDTASEASLDEAAARLGGSGAIFYGVEVRSLGGDRAALERLATAAGTRPLTAQEPRDLVALFDMIAADLTSSYRVSYRSEAQDGARTVTVTLEGLATPAAATVMVTLPGGEGEGGAAAPSPGNRQAPRAGGRSLPGDLGVPAVALLAAVSALLVAWAVVALRGPRVAGAPPPGPLAPFAGAPGARERLAIPAETGGPEARPSGGRPDRDPAAVAARAVRRTRTVLLALRVAVVGAVLGQSLALPLGAVRVTVVVVAVYAVLVVLASQRALRPDRVRLGLFAAAVAACWVAVLAGYPVERFSAISLLVVAVPWVWCVRAPFAWMHPLVVRGFLDAMVAVALLALVQAGLRLRGLPPVGLLATVLPEPWVLVAYLALAATAAVLVRAGVWRVALYGAGLVAAFGGLELGLLPGPLSGVVAEHGLVPGLAFAAFTVACLLWRVPRPALAACCLLVLFVLPPGPRPSAVLLAWTLTSLFARSRTEDP